MHQKKGGPDRAGPGGLYIFKSGSFENRFDYGGYQVSLPFPGAHQACNAAMAVEIALALWRQGYAISDEAILAGLKSAKFPARIEVLRRAPLVVLDGCHNPSGAAVLAATLKAHHPEKPAAVLGVMADKAVDRLLAALAPAFSAVYTVTPATPARCRHRSWQGARSRCCPRKGARPARTFRRRWTWRLCSPRGGDLRLVLPCGRGPALLLARLEKTADGLP